MKFLVHHKGFVLAWSFWFATALLLMVITSALAVFTKRPAPPMMPQPTLIDRVTDVATDIEKQRQWELKRQQEQQRRNQPAVLTSSNRSEMLRKLEMTLADTPKLAREHEDLQRRKDKFAGLKEVLFQAAAQGKLPEAVQKSWKELTQPTQPAPAAALPAEPKGIRVFRPSATGTSLYATTLGAIKDAAFSGSLTTGDVEDYAEVTALQEADIHAAFEQHQRFDGLMRSLVQIDFPPLVQAMEPVPVESVGSSFGLPGSFVNPFDRGPSGGPWVVVAKAEYLGNNGHAFIQQRPGLTPWQRELAARAYIISELLRSISDTNDRAELATRLKKIQPRLQELAIWGQPTYLRNQMYAAWEKLAGGRDAGPFKVNWAMQVTVR